MRAAAALLWLALAAQAPAQTRVVALPGKSPLVNFRIVFLTGAAADPADKPGLASLTAAMLAQGGTRKLTYPQIVDALFPLAASVAHQVDKEMTTFSAVTHADNLEAFYGLLRPMLLEPGWRPDDLQRLRDDHVNFLRVTLRGNNDEELGKEVLYNQIYRGHPYGRHNAGAVAGLRKITVDDLQRFYRAHYTRRNLILGLAGGYPAQFLERVKKDFETLPASGAAPAPLPQPAAIAGTRVTMIEKDTRSVAISLGFPIRVRRGHPDFLPLLVAQSWLGQHRSSGGRLYQSIREDRGLNYGDYAYIEYFPGGMFQFEPDPNLARHQQIFQLWLRPLEPPTAHFTLRLALYEVDKLLREGIPAEEFERTRAFLSRSVNLLTKTKIAELGYAIDSLYYGIPGYTSYVKSGLAKLTREDVQRAVRRHWRTENLEIVIIARGAEDLKKRLLAGEASPMRYNAPKPDEILREDKIVESRKIPLAPDAVRIVPVERIFE